MRLPPTLVILLKRWEFWRNQRLTRTALQALQLRKFRRMAAFLKERSPYYADIIRARSIDVATCTPQDFPVLTKSQLMAHFDRIVTDRRITKQAVADFLARSKEPTELFLGEFTVLHTSGSSGEVGMFVFSPQDWARGMAQVGRLQQLPMPGRRRKIASYHATDGHYGSVSWLNLLRTGSGRHYFDLLLLEINSPLPEVIEQLNAFQPEWLAGYVTGTKVLAEKQAAGVLKIAPREIAVGGEVLGDRDRAQIEQAFGCPVTNVYGCSEHHALGSSLPGGSTLRLWEDELVFELHEDHTLVTNLYNFTLPLVRYRMSDVLVPARHPVSNGPYLEVEGVVGRIENAPKFINRDGVEDFISPHTINEIFVPGVRRFQMQLTGKTSFRFVVCLVAPVTPQSEAAVLAGLRARLAEILRHKRMDNVDFQIAVADDLPVDSKTRKFRLIVDAVGPSPELA